MRYGLVAKALVASVIVLVAAPTAAGAAGLSTPLSQALSPSPASPEDGGGTRDGVTVRTVPNVVGMTRDDTTATLKQAGFTADPTPSDAAGDWTVTGQNPAGGTSMECCFTVTLQLEEPTVEVPDVVGDPLEQAEQEILGEGLVPSVAEGAAAEPRVVDSQDPPATTQVPRGSTVTLSLRAPTVPETPSSTGVEVPDLSGLTESAATRRLDGLGLTLVVGSGDSGRVSAQEPAAGSVVDPGSSVTVTLTPVTAPTDAAGPDITPSDTTGEAGEPPEEAGVIDPVETDSPSPAPPIFLLAVLVAAAALVWAVRRARRGPRPSPAASVVCVPYADLSPQVEIRDIAPSFSLDFVCHHDVGHQEIRETVR
ncbi:PASTA domain-containing protein [Nonomuraea basaltis]|uniref:PASTA domain-containing protein n=1 Tax=Nonomuraea basaltis TaxID=2495887 RepID=UPI00148657AA|nr:PASTA domain-containing protein [Nonomuraea basaltis]